ASSLARPPALRITCASPSERPAYFAGSRRASIHVRMANPLAGGRARFPLSPKPATYFVLAPITSSRILLLMISSYLVCRYFWWRSLSQASAAIDEMGLLSSPFERRHHGLKQDLRS